MVTNEYVKNLPVLIGIEEVRQILGVGKSRAYELAKLKDFPKLPIEKPIRIPRDRFLKWAGIEIEV